MRMELKCIFTNRLIATVPKENPEMDSLDVNTSNIMTEAQVLLVLHIITEVMEKEGIETNDDVIYDTALPFCIIILFKKHHNMTNEVAMARIKVQEEKKNLIRSMK